MNPGDARSERLQPLIVEVETSPASGVFRVEERLRVEEVALAGDDKVSSAKIAVRLDHHFDAVAARNCHLPDCRIIIRTHQADPADRQVLFEGYPPLMEAEWDGRPRRARDRCTFTAEHVYGRLARDRRSWIYGRRMRNGTIQDGLVSDPAAWQSASVRVGALPCLFNLDGFGNCSPDPITVQGPDGSPRTIYIFTYDEDPQARRWTYLNALRYLFWFYRLPEGPVGEGNLFSATDPYVAVDPDTNSSPTPDSELIRRLLAVPNSLTVEAANLVEALALLAAEAGVHVTADTVNDAGRADSRLRIWSEGDGPIRDLPLARGGRYPDGTPRFESRRLSAAEVYAANVIEQATIAWDHRRIVNAPVVIGGVKAYEMTVPLVPGWPPETDLDNVAPVDRPAAKTIAMTPDQVTAYGPGIDNVTWYRRYHKKGADFAQYHDVSRLWVLNEDGRFDGATYNRNAPFDDYRPFDFATVVSPEITTSGAWSRRARRLLNTITTTAAGDPFGVYVEVSFDSGTTWHLPKPPVRVRFDPTGVYFDVSNPTEVTPPDTAPEDQNMWYAIIDQTFRIRVTALIEGDDRLVIEHRPDPSETPTLGIFSRMVYRPTQYRYESRSGTTNVLAGINPGSAAIGVDDTRTATRLANRMALNEQDGQVRAVPVIPWVETTIAIGDRIAGIGGRGLSLGSRVSRRFRGPSVLGKRYRLSGGRLETELVLGSTPLPV